MEILNNKQLLIMDMIKDKRLQYRVKSVIEKIEEFEDDDTYISEYKFKEYLNECHDLMIVFNNNKEIVFSFY